MTSESITALPLEPRDYLEVAGSDAERFLNNYCTAKVPEIAEGTAAESFFPNEKGRILAHTLIERRENGFTISGYPGTAEALLKHLGKYAILDDVTLAETSGDWASFLVIGDGAPTLVAETMRDVDDTRFNETYEAVGRSVRVTAPVEKASATRDAIINAGAADGEDSLSELIRIEAGVPRVGIDLSDVNLVQEAARTAIAVSFTKGCYLGQEPIARLDAMGHTNKELRTIRLEAPVESGAEVKLDDGVVGSISSVASHDGQAIALAVLRKAACSPGTKVSIGATIGTVDCGPAHVSH